MLARGRGTEKMWDHVHVRVQSRVQSQYVSRRTGTGNIKYFPEMSVRRLWIAWQTSLFVYNQCLEISSVNASRVTYAPVCFPMAVYDLVQVDSQYNGFITLVRCGFIMNPRGSYGLMLVPLNPREPIQDVLQIIINMNLTDEHSCCGPFGVTGYFLSAYSETASTWVKLAAGL